MPFFLSHTSALDFWRTVYNPHRSPSTPAPARSALIPDTPCRLRELRAIQPPWLENALPALENGTIHVLVKRPDLRCGAQRICSHVAKTPFPEGSFYRYSDDLFIASPALAFVQLANELDIPCLAALGDELCGRYSFDPNSPRGIRSRTAPLTSSACLQTYVTAAATVGLPGASRAQNALRYLSNGAESPMETKTHLMLSLPYRYGGYGIPGLLFNQTIALSPTARTIALRNSCRADILLANRKLDIEFDGKHDHTGPDALESDRRRTNALAEMGYEVIELTSGQINDLAAFERIALRIAAQAHKRIERKYLGPLPARLNLRNALSAWNNANGRP